MKRLGISSNATIVYKQGGSVIVRATAIWFFALKFREMIAGRED